MTAVKGCAARLGTDPNPSNTACACGGGGAHECMRACMSLSVYVVISGLEYVFTIIGRG